MKLNIFFAWNEEMLWIIFEAEILPGSMIDIDVEHARLFPSLHSQCNQSYSMDNGKEDEHLSHAGENEVALHL